jgi:hypothetical protein
MSPLPVLPALVSMTFPPARCNRNSPVSSLISTTFCPRGEGRAGRDEGPKLSVSNGLSSPTPLSKLTKVGREEEADVP